MKIHTLCNIISKFIHFIPGKKPGETLWKETVITFEVAQNASSTPLKIRKKTVNGGYLTKYVNLPKHEINQVDCEGWHIFKNADLSDCLCIGTLQLSTKYV